MKPTRNRIVLILMASSIVLLLVLQLFWLQNSFEKAYFDLRRDTNLVFRNTLFTLRDSLMARSIEMLPGKRFPDPGDIESMRAVRTVSGDSMHFTLKSSTVQVYVSSAAPHDSITENTLRPLARTLQQKAGDGKSFIMRIAPDTVSIDTLNLLFRAALKQASRPLKFLITHKTTPQQDIPFRRIEFGASPDDSEIKHRIYSDTIFLDPVRINPLSRYQASVLNVQGVLLREIAPQILFSFFLTALTLLAFIVLYRNLRTQQRLMELKNDFISNMTHELKTPVSTVSVALEALKNFHGLDNPQRTQEYLEIAQNELNRLTLMTDKILKAAVFENQGIALRKEAVDLKVVTEKIINAMKVLFEKHRAVVSLKTEGNNFVVTGEETHLTNVIYNLIDNALKYSSDNPIVTITLRESDGHVELLIRDNGIGIPPEYQQKIFEKFFRVPTGDVHNAKGYGLGLSYVASIVKSHGGSIAVESEPSNGSSFRIIFPV